ncbi:hypothetical protein RB7641 [Rhodopirellula baltica SH 1]|uniref:Uncharacterized protein n=1 Tax=Rhodopirellula baltica (strain DSM 10527 / NCIMB 13988 / SH1) TaxID=243090 RepID=Q7UND4_RHOBA|nr:hypothetical protein RB7641 [Rhodopirellula baltica SH 1]
MSPTSDRDSPFLHDSSCVGTWSHRDALPDGEGYPAVCLIFDG